VQDTKQNLYFLLSNLLLSSLLALIYTNDIFTAYVFIEINTIAAGGLIVIANKGRTTVAGLRYMIMSLIGSGLLLFGLCILYDVTGHLLMEPCHEAIVQIFESGSSYETPLLVAIGLIGIGLCIKSALFPFSTWVPDAYGSSIAPSAAILSSLVSKGYIFLLIKICWRVVGYDYIDRSHLIDIFFVLGVAAMIIGSLSAIAETDIRRMIAYSSVAQIGYIYMGLGMGTKAGVIAACFHIISHGVTKALLFLAASDLSDASDRGRTFPQLRGAGLRNIPAGITFAVGALSMVGVPMLAGFTSKLLFAEAALDDSMVYTVVTLIALAISTVLNVIYFLRTVITIYTPDEHHWEVGQVQESRSSLTVSVIMIVLNLVLGLAAVPIVNLITSGIEMFS
jgi:multicomponent Na+:H+ antiporter subunit D